ncbi:hypothetical protein M3Y97_00157500 [Aphelenchoides bicaudatus]|nr:hypothetical protein M3Y97_00157500 [Aphelenchoides bicaudatus]
MDTYDDEKTTPATLEDITTDQLLNDDESDNLTEEEAQQKSKNSVSIKIDLDDNKQSEANAQENQSKNVEVNLILQLGLIKQQRKYARRILNTFYLIAFCVLVYTTIHTIILLYNHFS